MTQQESEMRIYVAWLVAYNNGILHGCCSLTLKPPTPICPDELNVDHGIGPLAFPP